MDNKQNHGIGDELLMFTSIFLQTVDVMPTWPVFSGTLARGFYFPTFWNYKTACVMGNPVGTNSINSDFFTPSGGCGCLYEWRTPTATHRMYLSFITAILPMPSKLHCKGQPCVSAERKLLRLNGLPCSSQHQVLDHESL